MTLQSESNRGPSDGSELLNCILHDSDPVRSSVPESPNTTPELPAESHLPMKSRNPAPLTTTTYEISDYVPDSRRFLQRQPTGHLCG